MAGPGQLPTNSNQPGILASQQTQAGAELDGGRFLANEFQTDSVRASFFQKIIGAINNVAAKVGVSVFGDVPPPPPITYVQVKASTEMLHVTLTHTPSKPVTRPINYFVEVDTSPHFMQPHVFDLGASRSLITTLPSLDDNGNPQPFYVRAYSQYPGSKPSAPTSFGGKPGAASGSAISVQMQGSSQMSLLPSTGSGTAGLNGQQGGSGFGKYPQSTPPNPKSFQDVEPNGPLSVSPLYLDRVEDGPRIYHRILTTHTANGVAYNFRGPWFSGDDYVTGDEVIYGPSYWLCLVDNTNSIPSTTNTNWQVVGSYSQYRGAWNAVTTYVGGDEVSDGGYFWIAVNTNLNSEPSATNSNWIQVGATAFGTEGNLVIDPGFTLRQNYWGGTGTITFPTDTDPFGNAGAQVARVQGASPLAELDNSPNGITYGNTYLYSCWIKTGGVGDWKLLAQAGTVITDVGAPTAWTQVSIQYTVPFGLRVPTFSVANASGTTDWLELYQPSITLVRSLDSQVSDGTSYARTKANGLHSGYTKLVDGQGIGTTFPAKGVGSTQTLDLDSEVADGTVYGRGTFVANSLSLDNANFEASASTPIPGWGAAGDGALPTLSYETGSPYAGSQSLKVVGNDASHYGWAYTLKQYSVTAGQQASASCYAKSDGTCVARLQIRCLTASGGYAGELDSAGTTSTSWNLQTVSGTIPANTVYVVIALQVNPGSGYTAYYDNVSFSLVLENAVDGPTRFAGTSSNISYRPTTNPLTSTNAGSNATISIASFNLAVRTQNVSSNVAYTSGSITGLSYGTLYYVYASDPTLAGGSISYLATTTKENTLGNTGYIFIGSIYTASSGGAATIGNNDGGVGGQSGNNLIVWPGSTSGSTSWTNPNNAIDGSLADYAFSGTASATLLLTQFSGIVNPGIKTITVQIVWSSTNGTGNASTVEYSTNGGSSFTTGISKTGNFSLETDTFTIAQTVNPALIQLKVELDPAWGTGNTFVYAIRLLETY